ncbi:hypothetical protein Gpo141_00012424 [Globisporangium polare]
MASSWSRFRMSPRARLMRDLLLVVLFFALDLRDVWFKIRWLGPQDSYSFAAITHHEMQENPLVPTRSLSFAGQKMQRTSGWSSFLQKCETLHPISDGATAQFSHTMGKNCEIGVPESPRKVPELVMSSSVRVDSMAWAACKLLYHHRKPAICHSSIVRLFSERYNLNEAPSLVTFKNHNVASLSTLELDSQLNYTAEPGSLAETELTALLGVISTSLPTSAVVCVEGFVPKGPGRYTSTIFGCANPTYYKSAFVGLHAAAFPLFQQDKARLSTDALHFMGMTFVTRENSRSLFMLRNGANGIFELKHKALLNFSSFGALYTVMIAIDVLLMVLNVFSAAEIGRLVLSKPQLSQSGDNVNRLNTASASTSQGYKGGVLTSPLYRSKPVIVLMIAAHLISWMVILPSISIWDATELQTGKTHAWLTAARCWVLPLVAFNGIWDLCVAISEEQTLAFARSTYVRTSEVACITALVAYIKRGAVFAITEKKRRFEMQRLSDTLSFREYTALSNAFSGQLDFLQNTTSPVLSIIYGPLFEIIAWSVVAIAGFVVVRSWYFRAMYNDILSSHHGSLMTTTKKRPTKFTVLPDASESPTKPLVADDTSDETRSVQFALASSPLSSPMRGAASLMTSPRDMDSAGGASLRLPLEELVEVPIRARSLVRSVWFMEKRSGQQLALHPSLLLEHGIVLEGREFMKTRRGFADVVHPYLSVRAHVPGDQQASSSSLSVKRSGVSSAQVPLR